MLKFQSSPTLVCTGELEEWERSGVPRHAAGRDEWMAVPTTNASACCCKRDGLVASARAYVAGSLAISSSRRVFIVTLYLLLAHDLALG